jgi:hypothetical protein
VSAERVVGVSPAAELQHRGALFGALREAFPTVRFEARAAGELRGADAWIAFGDPAAAEAAAASGISAVALLGPERPDGAATAVAFGPGAMLDRHLRGRTLTDESLGLPTPPAVPAGAEALAEAPAGPLWTRRGLLDVAAVAPLELEPGEQLRMRLRGGRFLALLPLIELLRGLADEGWEPPPPRATFLLDDPNLHWPSYGFVDLRELAEHGERHGYHLALAMVPLDGWFAHPRAAALLRERASLSLLVHGNDHLARELGRADGEALAMAAQAERRIAAFERRTGVPVARVMAPPHEACSAAIVDALRRTGFEAITMTRPFPWLSGPADPWLAGAPASGRLAGWHPADLTASGLPVMLRHPLDGSGHSPDEVVLRAYLNQPLVLYGHQEDLREGLDRLAVRAAEVNRLGKVRWASLDVLAATNIERRQDGERLHVRPYGRRAQVEVPATASTLVVERPPGSHADDTVRTAAGEVAFGEPFAVAPGATVELTLVAADAVSPAAVPAPPRRAWPVARRIAAEARDRTAPLRHRVASR